MRGRPPSRRRRDASRGRRGWARAARRLLARLRRFLGPGKAPASTAAEMLEGHRAEAARREIPLRCAELLEDTSPAAVDPRREPPSA